MDTVFATLTPWNRSAIVCFNNVAHAIQKYPHLYDHHARYIHLQDSSTRGDNRSARIESPGSSFSGTPISSSSLSSPPHEDTARCAGHFIFSIDVPPQCHVTGWRAGTLRNIEKCKTGGVDLLLALPHDSNQYHIRGQHAYFRFVRDSYAFAIRSAHKNNTKLGPDEVQPSDKFAVLQHAKINVSFGDLGYLLAFTVRDEEAFQKQKKAYIKKNLDWEQPIPSVSRTPSENDIHIGKWLLMRPAGAGVNGIIFGAISRSGQTVAVKRLNFRTKEYATQRIALLKSLGEHIKNKEGRNQVLRFVDVIHSGQSNARESYFLFDPLVRTDFQQALTSMIIEPWRWFELFCDAAKGLKAIHECDFVHGDIKPANIGIIGLQPPRACILDLDSIKSLKHGPITSDPGRSGGTIGYIAPEVEAKGSTFNHFADYWSLGCVGLNIFKFDIPWNARIKNDRGQNVIVNPWRDPETFEGPIQKSWAKHLLTLYPAFHARLEALSPMGNCLSEMLRFKPSSRVIGMRSLESLQKGYEDRDEKPWELPVSSSKDSTKRRKQGAM